jgi:ABC-type taurine transport system substrate-binding protein
MKLTIKKGGGIPFVRKAPYEYDGTQYEADIKNGDIIKILDSGNVEMGQFGEQKNFKVKTRNGEKKMAFNQATINVLIEEFGDESESWVGRDVKVILKKDVIAGKKVIIPYLVVDGWSLDEYGELVKEGETKKEDTIEYPEDKIDPDDIPF